MGNTQSNTKPAHNVLDGVHHAVRSGGSNRPGREPMPMPYGSGMITETRGMDASVVPLLSVGEV